MIGNLQCYGWEGFLHGYAQQHEKAILMEIMHSGRHSEVAPIVLRQGKI